MSIRPKFGSTVFQIKKRCFSKTDTDQLSDPRLRGFLVNGRRTYYKKVFEIRLQKRSPEWQLWFDNPERMLFAFLAVYPRDYMRSSEFVCFAFQGLGGRIQRLLKRMVEPEIIQLKKLEFGLEVEEIYSDVAFLVQHGIFYDEAGIRINVRG